MAVTKVEYKYCSGTGTGELTGTRSYTLVYEVWTNSATDGVMTVGNAPGIPHKGDVYAYGSEVDYGALCVSVTPRQVAAKVWEVTAQFKSQHGDKEKDVSNPLDQPPQRSWESVSMTVYPVKDLDDKEYVNSAKHPYDSEARATEIECPVFTMVRNEAYFDYATASYYNNSLNSGSFYGWPKGTGKLIITGREKFADNMSYVEVTYRVHFNPFGWQKKLVDKGPFCLGEWDTIDGVYQRRKMPSIDDEGNVSTIDVNLDGDGGKLAQDADLVYNDFKAYQELNWGPLYL
jgi:hypothetical protein